VFWETKEEPDVGTCTSRSREFGNPQVLDSFYIHAPSLGKPIRKSATATASNLRHRPELWTQPRQILSICIAAHLVRTVLLVKRIVSLGLRKRRHLSILIPRHRQSPARQTIIGGAGTVMGLEVEEASRAGETALQKRLEKQAVLL
jgi:hypothetical protein